MTKIVWDGVGERRYETGVDHGVLSIPDNSGAYTNGYAWNGLTTVTESPEGAEAQPQYADNIKYLNLLSAEELNGTIEAFTYPKEFEQCDGTVSLTTGVLIGQQTRKAFGFAYRTRIGTDTNADAGYKLHLLYGALAAPSEKAATTINDSPEAVAFSWEFSTTGVAVENAKPTASVTIDSTRVDAAQLAALETVLYGADGVSPRLPLPDEIKTLFSGSSTTVRLTGANAPSYNSTSHVVTLPAVTGVTWKVNGTTKAPGAQPAMTSGQTSVVTATAQPGYVITGDDDFAFDY